MLHELAEEIQRGQRAPLASQSRVHILDATESPRAHQTLIRTATKGIRGTTRLPIVGGPLWRQTSNVIEVLKSGRTWRGIYDNAAIQREEILVHLRDAGAAGEQSRTVPRVPISLLPLGARAVRRGSPRRRRSASVAKPDSRLTGFRVWRRRSNPSTRTCRRWSTKRSRAEIRWASSTSSPSNSTAASRTTSSPQNPEIELPDPPLHPTLITVRVDLVDARPPIWRRLELRGDLSLAEVHGHLQAAFGWLDSHLHRFDAPGASSRRAAYFVTEFDVAEGESGTDESTARLDQVLRAEGEKLRYTYDFGDDWEHKIVVEAVRPATDDDPPAHCTGGRGACPPEDVGGIHTFNELAAALRADPDPQHLAGDLEMYADWLPRGYDPDDFTTAEANEAIAVGGMSAEEVMRAFEQAPVATLPLELPQPNTEFGELLGKSTNEIRDLLGSIVARVPALTDDIPESELREGLRRWRTVLDVVSDDGVQLTGAGWLPPAAVQRILQQAGIDLVYGKGNREQHTPEVRALRERCQRAGLLRKSKGLLLLTKRGSRARVNDDELTAAIAQSLVPDKDELVQDARVVSLLFLAADWQVGPDSRWAADAAERGESLRPWEIEQAFWDDVAHMLTEIGWRLGPEAAPINRDDLRHDDRSAVLALNTDGPMRGLPRGAVVRKIARAALFE